MVSWNIAALFGSVSGDRRKQKKRLQKVMQLAETYGIVSLQEVHGIDEDANTLKKLLPHHIIHASFHNQSNTGGVILIIAEWIHKHFHEIVPIVIVKGRIIFAECRCREGARSMVFSSIHLPPDYSAVALRKILLDINGRYADNSRYTCFLSGDFNFTALGEFSLNVSNGTLHPACHTWARIWETCMSKWIEIFQPDPTWSRSINEKRIAIRIDKYFCNLPPNIISDAQPRAVTLNAVTLCAGLSDHVPLALLICLHSKKGKRGLIIPEWVPKHPFFEQRCDEFFERHVFPEHPILAMDDAKFFIKQAATDTMDAATRSAPTSPKEVAHWCLMAERAIRAKMPTRLADAIRALPALADFFTEDRHLSRHSDFYEFVRNKCEEANTAALEENAERNQKGDDHGSDARKAKLLIRASLFAPLKRRIALSTIKKGDGTPCLDDEEAADELFNYWAPVFKEGTPNRRAARYLLSFVPKAPVVEWELSFEAFCDLLDTFSPSAPGPDGIS